MNSQNSEIKIMEIRHKITNAVLAKKEGFSSLEEASKWSSSYIETNKDYMGDIMYASYYQGPSKN